MVIRRRYRTLIHALVIYAIAGGCVGYFLYHAQNGARGLNSKQTLKAEIAEVNLQIAGLKSERKAWEERVELLRRDAIDRTFSMNAPARCWARASQRCRDHGARCALTASAHTADCRNAAFRCA